MTPLSSCEGASDDEEAAAGDLAVPDEIIIDGKCYTYHLTQPGVAEDSKPDCLPRGHTQGTVRALHGESIFD